MQLEQIIGGVLTAGLEILSSWQRAHEAARRNVQPIESAEDEEALKAAELLGVDVDASADEIRAALRHKMAEERAHPDQGGDPVRATELVAAKNLLIDRANERDA